MGGCLLFWDFEIVVGDKDDGGNLGWIFCESCDGWFDVGVDDISNESVV